MAEVIAWDEARLRRDQQIRDAARPTHLRNLRESVDLESKKRIDRERTALLTALHRLACIEGMKAAVEFAELAVGQLKMGTQP
jgi:hypothetical protein